MKIKKAIILIEIILEFQLLSQIILQLYVKMVRGYDPVSSDLSSLIWNHLFSFWTDQNRITLQQSQKYVRHWLKNSQQTSSLYAKFSQNTIKPTIRLKKHCSYSSLQDSSTQMRQQSRHFPAAIVNNQIIVCLDKIQNKVHLKENIDRQLAYLHLQQSHKKEMSASFEEEERGLMKNLYESCYQGYRNYRLSEEVTKEMSIVCSKYLFFRKSKSNLPIDRKFRYTTQLADELQI